MQVDLRIRNIDLEEVLLSYIERRLRFAFSWFGDRVGRIAVNVSGLNGPRGGTSKNCSISADIAPLGRLVVEESALDVHAAIDRAIGRMGRLIGQRLERAPQLTTERVMARVA
jgi:ribosome-associated translation inhibitor RaiA